MIRRLLACLLALPLLAQAGSRPAPTEQEIIRRYRKRSAPRPVAPAAPLTAAERNTIQRFKEAKSSVVFISAVDPETPGAASQTGSGFVWDEWGHIVTNHHVISVERDGRLVKDLQDVEITLSDGKAYKGRVIGASFAADIAVIQAFAPLEAMRPMPLGSSRTLKVGQSVLAIGNPFGLDHSLSTGVVSALGRAIPTGYQTTILDSIQTDAAINPGNSGGPLLDSGGRLIGMNTSIVATPGEGSVGVGFAIPVDTLNRIVPRLIAQERLEPPRMGFKSLGSYDAARIFHLRRGLMVGEVEPDSPAARAGLRPLVVDQATGQIQAAGDILLGYQGRAIESDGQLMAMLEVDPPGDEVVFDVLRNGQIIKVVLDLRPAAKDKPKAQPASI